MDSEIPDEFYRGLDLYWKGHYWYAHEQWEQVWLQAQEPIRSLMKALIQIAAALIHSERRQWRGVSNLLARVTRYLDRCPEELWGVDIDDLRRQVADYRCRVKALSAGEGEFRWSLKPKIRPRGVEPPTVESLQRSPDDGPDRPILQ